MKKYLLGVILLTLIVGGAGYWYFTRPTIRLTAAPGGNVSFNYSNIPADAVLVFVYPDAQTWMRINWDRAVTSGSSTVKPTRGMAAGTYFLRVYSPGTTKIIAEDRNPFELTSVADVGDDRDQ